MLTSKLTREQCLTFLSFLPPSALNAFRGLLEAERAENEDDAREFREELGNALADILDRAFEITHLTIDDALREDREREAAAARKTEAA